MHLIMSVAVSLLGQPVLAGGAQGDQAPAFEDSALRQAIPAGVKTILVAVVGRVDDRTAASGNGVAAALVAAGYRTKRSIQPPGTFADRPTAAMTERLCSFFRLDLVAVVEPATTGGVTVELLDRTGTVVGRAVLPPRPAAAAPPHTVSPVAAAPIQGPGERPLSDPRLHALGAKLYELQHVTLAGHEAHQGRDRRPLDGADFYATVGRPDLAEQYRSRARTKGVVRGVGGAAAGIGVVWGIVDVMATAATRTAGAAVSCVLSGGPMPGKPDESYWCQQHEPSPLPWIVAGLGLGMVIAPSFVPTDPVSETERRQLVDSYNDRLRARSGLGSARRRGADGLTMRVAPVLRSDGGGLLLAGSF